MSEPHTAGAVSLVTLAVAIFGPNFGPYVVIVLGSISGSFWALAMADTMTKLAGAMLLLRTTFTAVVLTALISTSVASIFGVKEVEAYAAVAFCIGALGNKWFEIFESIKNRVITAITTSGGAK